MEPRLWHRHYEPGVPTTINYPRLLAQDLLHISAGTNPDKAALNFYGTEMTFWELRRQSLRMANALSALGVKKGERVGIHLPNCPQYIIAYLATLYLGAIVVNLNPMYTADELKPMVEDTGIKTLFTFGLVLPIVRTVIQDVDIPRIVVTKVTDYISGMAVSTPASLGMEKGWHHFTTIVDNCTDVGIPRVQIAPEDPAMIQFTGGTTGIYKGAVLTHTNMVAATLQSSLWGSSLLSLISPERRTVLAILPFFHVYGNIVALNWALANCATLILIPRLNVDETMGLLAYLKEITFFPAVPTLIAALIKHPRAVELELDKKLRLLFSGGAPMSVELTKKIQDMGIYFTEGYGLTESTSLGTSNPILGLKKAGSIGIPFPDTDVRLVDIEEGVKDVPQGEPGEIIMKSPLIMKEYWNNPEETANQLKDGWLYTGDIATMDEDGYFFIVDIKKDMINAGGFNIYPREIDEVLHQHPRVKNAVAVGIPHEYRGETVKAFIVLKPGEIATPEEITSFCKQKLAAYKVPKIVEFRNSLPPSLAGLELRKVLKKEEKEKKQKGDTS